MLLQDLKSSDAYILYSQLSKLVAYRFHVKQKKIAQQNRLMASSGSAHHAIRKGRGMTFSEVRLYQSGDDIRHIDWRVTARTQKVHTKVFIEEHERPIILVTEQTPVLFFGSQVRLKSVQVLNLAAILAWTALAQKERVGGLTFNQSQQSWIAPKTGPQSVLHYLQQSIYLQNKLSSPGQSQVEDWQKQLQYLLKVVKPGSKLFLIGDMLQLSDKSLQLIRRIRKHNDVVVIHLYDELEKNLPKLGWLSLTQVFGAKNLLKLNSDRVQTRHSYKQHYQLLWQSAQDKFIQMHIPFIEIGCHEPPLKSLLKNKVII